MSSVWASVGIGLATGVVAGLATGMYSGLVVSRMIRFLSGRCGELKARLPAYAGTWWLRGTGGGPIPTGGASANPQPLRLKVSQNRHMTR